MFAERILAEFLVKSSSIDESRLPKSVGQRQPVKKTASQSWTGVYSLR
jgi:hypothetical protein